MVIYKFELGDSGVECVRIRMPDGAEILSVGVQAGGIVLWATVDPDAQRAVRSFAVIGTGWDVPPEVTQYLGTVQIARLVWHVFELSPGR